MRIDQAQAYVESLLERLLKVEKVWPDPDGDYPMLYGHVPYYVRVIGRPDAVVRVFSVALDQVEATPDLLGELNELNATSTFTRAFHAHGQVLVVTEVLADSLDPAGFGNACECVGRVAADVAAHLQERFGGELTFLADADAEEGMPSAPVATGQYL